MKNALCLIVGLLGIGLFQYDVASSFTGSPSSAKNRVRFSPSALGSPTPEGAISPVIIDTEPEKPPADLPSDELSSLDVFDLLVGSTDVDCDGVPNRDDNCPLVYNPAQKDKNRNGIGDACEGKAAEKKDFRCDTDKDGIWDRYDNCILVCNPDQKDKNKNGIGDVCDPDLLKDWVRIDPCPKPARHPTSKDHQ